MMIPAPDPSLILLAFWGPAAFVAVFLATLIGILLLPQRLVAQPPGLPWWKNVRLWAVVICVVQMVVYAVFG